MRCLARGLSKFSIPRYSVMYVVFVDATIVDVKVKRRGGSCSFSPNCM